MQQPFIKYPVFKGLALFVFLTTAAFTGKTGGDMYEVYLNNKLIFKQYMTQPLKPENLQLTKANMNDRLIIKYSHCGQTGKGRSITLKDANGNSIRTWKFADAKDADAGMVIPVKEILQQSKSVSGFTLTYTSREIPKGQMLTSFRVGQKSEV